MRYEPVHRTILAVDIERFGGQGRTDRIRAELRKALDDLLEKALAGVSISESDCHRADIGDGVLVLFSPEVSKLRLIDPFVPGLAAGLEAYNRRARVEARLRVRVVLHAGEVVADEHGYFGADLNHAFRLLDSTALRRHLATTDAPLTLIVSQAIHDGIIKHRFGGLDPSNYQPVQVTTKQAQRLRAWIWAPPHRTNETDDDPRLVERIQRAFAHEEPMTEWSAILARASTQRADRSAVVVQHPTAEGEPLESAPRDDPGYQFLASADAEEYLQQEVGMMSENDRDEILATAMSRYLEMSPAGTVRSSRLLAWQLLTRVALNHRRLRGRQGVRSELSGGRPLAWNVSHSSTRD